MTFRVGVIGCGPHGKHHRRRTDRKKESNVLIAGGLALPYSHAAGYAAIDETDIVAACDIQ